MKKALLLAMCLCSAACYAPLNNSGVSTTKEWLDIPAKKTDFGGSQYDSCYQFRLHFAPADAVAALDGQNTCIDRCCWRSDQTEVVLDFNKDFQRNLEFYGRADKYTPGKITLKVTHSNLLNTTAVSVSPRGAITRNGTVKLKRETIENPHRLAQIESQNRSLSARRNAYLADMQILREENTAAAENEQTLQRARALVRRQQGPQIDLYFYNLDKTYKQKGYIFLLSGRIYTARQNAPHVYRVTCRAKVQSGSDANHLEHRTISCGTWNADLATSTVSPADSTARRIRALR